MNFGFELISFGEQRTPLYTGSIRTTLIWPYTPQRAMRAVCLTVWPPVSQVSHPRLNRFRRKTSVRDNAVMCDTIVNLHCVRHPSRVEFLFLISFPASRTLLIGFSPEWGGTTRLENDVLGDWLWELVSPRIHASPPTLWTVLPTWQGTRRVCSKKKKTPCPQVWRCFLGPNWLIGCSPSA